MASRWWTEWTVDPGVVVWLAAAAVAYRVGTGRLRRPPGRGRVACYAGGLVTVAVALVSPIDWLAERLFAIHMVQHLLLGLLAPLLLVLAHPGPALGQLVPASVQVYHRTWLRWRRLLHIADRSGWGAIVAAGVSLGVLGFWHVPGPYDTAVRHGLVHLVEHASFLLTGLWFWWAVLGPVRVRWRARMGVSVLALFFVAVGSGALAALLTLAPAAFYPVHATTTEAFGLTPLEDQQFAGAVMWVPGGIAYTVAALAVLLRWLESGPTRHAPPPDDDAPPDRDVFELDRRS